MARYIDADKLIAEYDRVHIGAPGGARKLMVDAPTADVVPKSEFEKLQEAYNNRLAKDIQTNADFVRYAQAEVAREIFEDLEMYVEEHDGCSVNLSRCEFAELKKKYTGDQT